MGGGVVFWLGVLVGVFCLFVLHLYYGLLTPQKSHLINERKRISLEIYAIVKQSNFSEIPNPQNHWLLSCIYPEIKTRSHILMEKRLHSLKNEKPPPTATPQDSQLKKKRKFVILRTETLTCICMTASVCRRVVFAWASNTNGYVQIVTGISVN